MKENNDDKDVVTTSNKKEEREPSVADIIFRHLHNRNNKENK